MKKETIWIISYFDKDGGAEPKEYKGTLLNWLENYKNKTVIKTKRVRGIR